MGEVGGMHAEETYSDEENDIERQRSVADLQKIGRAAVEYLIIDLWDTNKWVRITAVNSLAHLGDLRSFEYIIPLLSDPDHDVRFAAAIGLGKLKDKRGIEPLKNACNDDNCYVRVAAEESLKRILQE
jgi:HEAT repeat protein